MQHIYDINSYFVHYTFEKPRTLSLILFMFLRQNQKLLSKSGFGWLKTALHNFLDQYDL